MKIRPLPAVFVALGLAVAGQAGAQPLTAYSPPPPVGKNISIIAFLPWGGETRAEPVRYNDLDLSSDAGAATLLDRIRGAARRTCSPSSTVPDTFGDTLNFQQCFGDAVAQAVAGLNIPTLTHVYETTGKGSSPRGRGPG